MWPQASSKSRSVDLGCRSINRSEDDICLLSSSSTFLREVRRPPAGRLCTEFFRTVERLTEERLTVDCRRYEEFRRPEAPDAAAAAFAAAASFLFLACKMITACSTFSQTRSSKLKRAAAMRNHCLVHLCSLRNFVSKRCRYKQNAKDGKIVVRCGSAGPHNCFRACLTTQVAA